jgi:rubredoxin
MKPCMLSACGFLFLADPDDGRRMAAILAGTPFVASSMQLFTQTCSTFPEREHVAMGLAEAVHRLPA